MKPGTTPEEVIQRKRQAEERELQENPAAALRRNGLLLERIPENKRTLELCRIAAAQVDEYDIGYLLSVVPEKYRGSLDQEGY
jgi:hypothetical protein